MTAHARGCCCTDCLIDCDDEVAGSSGYQYHYLEIQTGCNPRAGGTWSYTPGIWTHNCAEELIVSCGPLAIQQIQDRAITTSDSGSGREVALAAYCHQFNGVVGGSAVDCPCCVYPDGWEYEDCCDSDVDICDIEMGRDSILVSKLPDLWEGRTRFCLRRKLTAGRTSTSYKYRFELADCPDATIPAGVTDGRDLLWCWNHFDSVGGGSAIRFEDGCEYWTDCQHDGAGACQDVTESFSGIVRFLCPGELGGITHCDIIGLFDSSIIPAQSTAYELPTDKLICMVRRVGGVPIEHSWLSYGGAEHPDCMGDDFDPVETSWTHTVLFEAECKGETVIYTPVAGWQSFPHNHDSSLNATRGPDMTAAEVKAATFWLPTDDWA
jgi:hypothetical protein